MDRLHDRASCATATDAILVGPRDRPARLRRRRSPAPSSSRRANRPTCATSATSSWRCGSRRSSRSSSWPSPAGGCRDRSRVCGGPSGAARIVLAVGVVVARGRRGRRLRHAVQRLPRAVLPGRVVLRSTRRPNGSSSSSRSSSGRRPRSSSAALILVLAAIVAVVARDASGTAARSPRRGRGTGRGSRDERIPVGRSPASRSGSTSRG